MRLHNRIAFESLACFYFLLLILMVLSSVFTSTEAIVSGGIFFISIFVIIFPSRNIFKSSGNDEPVPVIDIDEVVPFFGAEPAIFTV